MDGKDPTIESALGAHNDDCNPKYAQSGTALQTNSNKTYHDIGSNLLAKVDVPTARPCAIIGPDRVVPPQSMKDVYLKKVPVEPWPCADSIYQHPPEYPHKPVDYHPPRNISPRQTFQENMQRIMVPPTYASVKTNEDHSLKNPKLMPFEAKYCDVPYSISPINNEPKIIKSSEGPINNSAPHFPQQSWAGSGVNVRPLRPYGAPELYQYSEYPNGPGPRPISMIRPQRNVHEDLPQVYQDRFYHEANIRLKPYPTTKERTHQHPQPRYDYIANYPNTFHPHIPYPPHKYELHKSTHPHPYSVYPQMPLKYLDRRMPAPTMEKYVRTSSQQINFNPPFCNQNIPPTYGSASGNCLPNRVYSYASDPATKPMIQNRLYVDSNNAHKYYPSSENMYINDINRTQAIKNDVMYPSYPPINIHSLPPHHIYRKESSMKGYEHALHYRNVEYTGNMNTLSRLPLQFSPQTMSISPADSNTSNDTAHTLANAQEDCGYVSQSSTASVRSIESGANRLSRDLYRRQNIRYEPHYMTKTGQKSNTSTSPKDKKGLDVRQFLQMWNEGDDEGNDTNKETSAQQDSGNYLGRYESATNQEQLYVLGLVNVPNEELGKYDHIQKISKLPENIKGYNSIELLNQYEKLVESTGMNHYSLSPSQSKHKDSNVPIRNNVTRQGLEIQPRPISPLDVEAKISQSVIHKEVGCNFEIRPCSPQMLNVEIATPVHSVLGERLIEKVANPVITKSPMHRKIDETNKDTPLRNSPKIPSCKMVSNQYPSPNLPDSLKTIYSLQDLESNSGVCLASLPRLDTDIELNFPEINQQFIDANKTESVKISSIGDLPILDTDNAGSVLKTRSYMNNKSFISETYSGSESDKEVSKLSKYRKHKKSTSIAIESEGNIIQHLPLHRTDSVIIKNPDNIKGQEEYLNHVTLINNIPDSGKVNPINVLLQDNRSTKISDKDFTETVTTNLNEHTPINTNDTAIDFSLNKTNDKHRNHLQSLNNFNDSLQINNELDRNMYMASQNSKVSNQNTLEHLQKNSASDDLTILQRDSVTLGNIASPNVQLIDKDSQILPTHDTVITHSNSRETVTDTSLASALIEPTEEIVLHDNLPLLSPDTDDSSNVTISNLNISPNISLQCNSSENQVQDNCLAKEADNLVSSICKPNLVVQNVNDINVTSDIDLVNKLNEDRITGGVVLVGNVHTSGTNESLNLSNYTNNEKIINDTNTTNECEIKKNQIVASISELKSVTETPFKNSVKDIFIPENNNEESDKETENEETRIETPIQNTDKEILSFEREIEENEAHTPTHNNDQDIFTSVEEHKKEIKSPLQNTENKMFIPERENEEKKAQTSTQNTDKEIFAHKEETVETEIKTLFQDTNPNFLKPEMENEKAELETTIANTYSEMFKPAEDSENVKKSGEFGNHFNTINQEFNHISEVITDNEDLNLSIKKNNEICCNPCKDSDDSKHIFLNHFVPKITRYPDSDMLINEINTENILIDTTDLPNCLSKQNTAAEKSKDSVKSYKIRSTFIFKKELFSPWLQKLIIYNEGFCTSLKRCEKENKAELNKFSYMNSWCSQEQDSFKTLADPYVKKDNIELVSKFYVNSPPSSIKFEENTIEAKAEFFTFTEFVANEKELKQSYQSDSDVKSKNVKQTAMKTNSTTESIHPESVLTVENYGSESVVQLTEHKMNENSSVVDYDAQINASLTKLIKGKPSLAEQLSNIPFRRNGRALKRSLSEPAITEYNDGIRENFDNRFMHASKRTKIDNSEILVHSQVITDNFTSFIQNNRRNSTSTIYNHDNVSFCILIDNNCVLADEIEDCQKMCYTEMPDECLTTICTEVEAVNSELTEDISYIDSASVYNSNEAVNSALTEDMSYEGTTTICDERLNSHLNEDVSYYSPKRCEYDNEFILQNMEDKTIEETWVEDVACMETVFSDDIAEDVVISAASSPKDSDSSEEEIDNTNFLFNVNENEHTKKVKHIYGNQMCADDAQLVDKLYRTPQMDVNKTLIDRESQHPEEYNRYYDNESLEKVLSESNFLDTNSKAQKESDKSSTLDSNVLEKNKENVKGPYPELVIRTKTHANVDLPEEVDIKLTDRSMSKENEDCLVHSCESSNLVSCSKEDKLHYAISSSPEVSSTTPEEKSSGILLKIRSYKGSKISEVNEMGATFNNTHSQRFDNYTLPISRPLITKAAQKYIPPLKETIRDLKVKIHLPKQSLFKLQQLKKSKEEPKKNTSRTKHYIKNLPQENPKKVKPKFEDVLKSIDEIQFKKHKEKHKKIKQSIPKVIIKKNENGAHFASTQSKDTFNPDLTGRKWQPWVFLEKSKFIDKMALKQKCKAIYSHRKKTYILAESFRKYKSISSAKFVITHPKSSDSLSTGKLKYTFRLTHS